MAQAKVVETINAPIARVWAWLGNFSGIEVGPGIEAVEYEGEGVGMTRSMRLSIGTVVERLNRHDSESTTLAYEIVNDDSPLPFSDYSATLQLHANDDGTTRVEWAGQFEPRGATEERAVQFAKTIYSNAIAGARSALQAD